MFKIARKELKIFFTDKRALFLSFLLPISLISLFALAFGGMNNNSKPREYDLLVSDLDNSSESKKVIAELDSNKTIRVVQEKYEDAQDEVKKGKQDAVLIFHKGFSDSTTKAIELQYDEAQSAQIGLLQQALYSTLFKSIGSASMKKRILKQIDEKYSNIDKAELENIHKQIEENFSGGKSSPFSDEQNGNGIKMTAIVQAKDDAGPGLVQAVSGTTVMMLLFSMAAMGASLMTEKEEGTLRKLLVSPIHPNQILFGKMIAANAVSTIQLVMMLVFSYFVFHLNIFQNVPALILLILSTVFACSSFGIFLTAIAKTRQQVDIMSRFIILAMSAIGGSMIPSFIMPEWMQKISVVSVNYWSIQGFYDIFWRRLPLMDSTFLMRIGVLFFMGCLLTFISLRFFRKNILKMY